MKVLSNKEYSHVIAWMPSGKSFTIRKPKLFAALVLPQEFKQAKQSSFTRKLHRWGFMRHYRGCDAGAYFHKDFQKGRLDLAERMTCFTGKATTSETLSASATQKQKQRPKRPSKSKAAKPVAAAKLRPSTAPRSAPAPQKQLQQQPATLPPPPSQTRSMKPDLHLRNAMAGAHNSNNAATYRTAPHAAVESELHLRNVMERAQNNNNAQSLALPGLRDLDTNTLLALHQQQQQHPACSIIQGVPDLTAQIEMELSRRLLQQRIEAATANRLAFLQQEREQEKREAAQQHASWMNAELNALQQQLRLQQQQQQQQPSPYMPAWNNNHHHYQQQPTSNPSLNDTLLALAAAQNFHLDDNNNNNKAASHQSSHHQINYATQRLPSTNIEGAKTA